MHLRYCTNCSSYTMQRVHEACKGWRGVLRSFPPHLKAAAGFTRSAHPARFTPEDKYSRHRVTIKQRYGLLPRTVGKK